MLGLHQEVGRRYNQGPMSAPCIIVLAGPNGAGKSTLAPALLHGQLQVNHFVNADVIAQGLSGFAPESTALAAGRIMLRHMSDLARRRISFSFETTLSSRTFSPWLATLRSTGYRVHLIFLWLPSPGFARQRVALRVQSGGHNVPPEVISRRFFGGIKNLFDLYLPVSDSWRIYDSSGIDTPRRIAHGSCSDIAQIDDPAIWSQLRKVVNDG